MLKRRLLLGSLAVQVGSCGHSRRLPAVGREVTGCAPSPTSFLSSPPAGYLRTPGPPKFCPTWIRLDSSLPETGGWAASTARLASWAGAFSSSADPCLAWAHPLSLPRKPTACTVASGMESVKQIISEHLLHNNNLCKVTALVFWGLCL